MMIKVKVWNKYHCDMWLIDYFPNFPHYWLELDPSKDWVVVCFAAAQSCHGQQCWSWV